MTTYLFHFRSFLCAIQGAGAGDGGANYADASLVQEEVAVVLLSTFLRAWFLFLWI